MNRDPEAFFRATYLTADLHRLSDEGKVTVRVEGTSQEGHDPSWFRHAVEEPLDEADIERITEMDSKDG